MPSTAKDDDDDVSEDDEAVDLVNLVRRARAIARASVPLASSSSAAAAAALPPSSSVATNERSRELWGQAITSRGRRYYFSTRGEGVQWETPREWKGSTTKTFRAELCERASLPSGWRELKSTRSDQLAYYWNARDGVVQWERPRNEELPRATVVRAKS